MRMEEGGIPVLFDGEGYEIWSKKMKTLFVSLDLWNLVQQGYQDMGDLGENRKKDCKALYMIQQGVSNRIFPVIMKADTSKEAWEAIRDRFHHHGRHDQRPIEEIEEEEMHFRTTMRMQKMVSKLIPIYPERCIFRVPDSLRLGNEEFYELKVLSIGPYHRGKPRLASMEEHKIRYLQELLQEKEQNVHSYIQAIKPHEERVRKCYGESIDSVSSDDLFQMLVLDGCFIIQLFLRMEVKCGQQHYSWFQHYSRFRERQKVWRALFNENDDVDLISSKRLIKFDPVINSDILLNALQNDLLLVENQIPFFIIKILYGVINGGIGDLHIITQLKLLVLPFLCRKYLTYELLPQIKAIILNVHDMCHLLDLAHKTISICPIKEDEIVRNSEESNEDVTFCFVDSATKLEEANVKLKARKKLNFLDIRFNKGKLSIPSFSIDYHLEVDIRNFIALELCQQDPKKRYFCDYVVFMDHLITSPDDVKLLIHRGIITNQLIDANFVDNMFKMLTRNIVTSNPYTYYQISTDLNKYCDKRLNKWCAGLKQKYFKSPWTFISILAASMLLVLTFTQTVYSIISYYK